MSSGSGAHPFLILKAKGIYEATQRLGVTRWLKHPPCPGTSVTICVSYFMKGGPGNTELISYHQPDVWKTSKGDATCWTTSQSPPRWHPPWLSNVCATKKDPESECLAKDNPETNPITVKPETASHMAEQSSWAPSPYCSPPGHPFPVKSLSNVWQEPTLGPWKWSPFLQLNRWILYLGRTCWKSFSLWNKGSHLVNCSESLLPSLRASNTGSDFSYAPLLSDAATRKGTQSKAERYKCNLKW